MAKRQASEFINTVIYKVDKSSLKKVRDTNNKLQKEFEKSSPMGGGGRRGITRQKASMDAHLKLREKHLNKVAKLEERNRERSKRSAAKASKQGFDSTISGLGAGKGAGAASNTAFADMLRGEEKLANAKTKARVAGERKAARAAELEAKRAAKRREKIDIFTKEKLGHLPKTQRMALKNDMLREKSNARLNQTMRSILKKERERTRQLGKQNALTKRMGGSVMQLAGGFVSAFGAIEALTAITQTGMRMESINKAMIASSSGTKEAASNMKFVRDEAMRLGVPLLDASHSFAKLRAAAGDKMSVEELKTVFTGVAEAATVLGLKQDDVAGTFLALQQMMSKGKVQADELTQQLGERLPIAMRAMGRAAEKAGLIPKGLSGQEREALVFKLMEQGKLLSDQVLPELGREFSNFAHANNGLAIALDQNLAPAIGRAKNHFVEMQNEFFLGGWKEGLMFITQNFNDQADAIKSIFRGLGAAVNQIVRRSIGQLQLQLASIIDIVNALKSAGSLMDKTKAIGSALLDQATMSPTMGLGLPNPLFIGRNIVEDFAAKPHVPQSPYKPSSAFGNNSLSPKPSSTKVEVTVKGTDGLIEVVDARVEDGMQGQFNSVLSVTGEQ